MQPCTVVRMTSTSASAAPAASIADATSGAVAVSAIGTIDVAMPAASNAGLSSTFAAALPPALSTLMTAAVAGCNVSIVYLARPAITPVDPAVNDTPAGVTKSSTVSPLP